LKARGRGNLGFIVLDQTSSSTATTEDHVVVLFTMLIEIDRLWQKITDTRERMEASLSDDDPGRCRATYIEVGRRRCGSVEEIQQLAKQLGIDPAPFISEWWRLEHQRIAARRRLGLDQFDLADRMARSGYFEIRKQIGRTAATSQTGIAAKVEILVAGLRDGLCGDELDIAESVLGDIKNDKISPRSYPHSTSSESSLPQPKMPEDGRQTC
jgi:hypothetical protein